MSCECKENLPVIALWSGGMDSSFMLINLILRKRNVEAVSLEVDIAGTDKLNKEREARNKLKPHLIKLAKRLGGSICFSSVHVDTPKMAFKNPRGNKLVCDDRYCKDMTVLGGVQRDVHPVLWAGALSNILIYAPDNCEVAFGYCMDSYTSPAKNHLSNIVESMGKGLGKDIKVTYPIQYLSKERMLYEMFNNNNYRPILVYSHSCECPNGEIDHCRKCSSCRSLRDAIMNIVLDEYLSWDTRKYFEKILASWFGVSCSHISVNKNEESMPDEKKVCESKKSKICNDCNLAAAHTCLLCGCDFSSPYASDCLCEKCKSMLSSRN